MHYDVFQEFTRRVQGLILVKSKYRGAYEQLVQVICTYAKYKTYHPKTLTALEFSGGILSQP